MKILLKEEESPAGVDPRRAEDSRSAGSSE